jgi:uncharacterized protein (DUF4415 family)
MKDEYDFSSGTRGPIIPTAPGKTRITLSVDTETLDWFRQQPHASGGGDYRALINDALAQHVIAMHHSGILRKAG